MVPEPVTPLVEFLLKFALALSYGLFNCFKILGAPYSFQLRSNGSI